MTLCRQVEEGLTGTTRIKTKRHRPEGLNLQRLRCEKLKYRPAVIASNNYRIVFYSSWRRNWTFEYYTKIRLHIVNKCSLYFVPASCSSGQQIKFSVNPVTLVIRLNWSTLPFRIVTLLSSYVRLKLLFCIFVCISCCWSLDSSVGILIRLRFVFAIADRRVIYIYIYFFFSFMRSYADREADRANNSKHIGKLHLLGQSNWDRRIDHSRAVGVEFKNATSCTSTPHIF